MKQRQQNIKKLETDIFDVLIVGGGIKLYGDLWVWSGQQSVQISQWITEQFSLYSQGNSFSHHLVKDFQNSSPDGAGRNLTLLAAWADKNTSAPFTVVNQIKNKEPLINTDNSRGGVEYSDAYLHDNDAMLGDN